MSERKKLSLGSPAGEKADKTSAWNVSEARKDKLHDRARYNRRNPSEAEERMWSILKDKGIGNFAFTRQVVMGSSIVDFACKARWLVIEISSGGEAERKIAELSDRKLADVGVRVLRFTEEEVMGDLELIRQTIFAELQKPFDKPRRENRGDRDERPAAGQQSGTRREFHRQGSIR